MVEVVAAVAPPVELGTNVVKEEEEVEKGLLEENECGRELEALEDAGVDDEVVGEVGEGNKKAGKSSEAS